MLLSLPFVCINIGFFDIDSSSVSFLFNSSMKLLLNKTHLFIKCACSNITVDQLCSFLKQNFQPLKNTIKNIIRNRFN